MYIKRCKDCGKILTVDNCRTKTGCTEKRYFHNQCHDCERAYWRKYDAKKREENRIVLNPDVEMRFPRKYKQVASERILDVSEIDLPLVGDDEIFVRVMDAAGEYFVSNYGRMIETLPNGKMMLLKGNHAGQEDMSYTMLMNGVENRVLKVVRKQVYIKSLVCENFIVNWDKAHTVAYYRLHSGNDGFYYYRDIFPLNQKQLNAVKQFYRENGYDSEEVVMNIYNDPRYMPDDMCVRYYEPKNMGHGYAGCCDADSETLSHKRWRGMLYRVYSHKCPGYNDVTVCDEWLSYANFREYFDSHYYEIKGQVVDLDKDFYSGAKLEYSPETSVFCPHVINVVDARVGKADRGLPEGVLKERNRYRIMGTKVGLKKKPSFQTVEQAAEAYRKYKVRYMKKLATKYKDKIPYNLYRILRNYKC